MYLAGARHPATGVTQVPVPARGPTAAAWLQGTLHARLHAATALKRGTLLKRSCAKGASQAGRGGKEGREMTTAIQTPFYTIKDLYN